jgi:RNA recognition motif-containing protein
MKIYVGNLSYQTTEDDVRKAFESHGQVSSVAIITDKFSGESKGFGFVEMDNKDEATAAMAALNGADMNGRKLNVSEARPKTDNRSRGGSGGGRGYGKNW